MVTNTIFYVGTFECGLQVVWDPVSAIRWCRRRGVLHSLTLHQRTSVTHDWTGNPSEEEK